jgi:hypothetical protein
VFPIWVLVVEKRVDKWRNGGVLLVGLAVEKWEWGDGEVGRWVKFGLECGLWWVDGASEGR